MTNLIAIFVGGGLGSLMRYAISVWLPVDKAAFPWHTFLANMLACLLLGIVVAWISSKTKQNLAYSFLAIGLCGGFSTFSTFSLEGLKLLQQNAITTAFLYTVLSVLIGLGLIATSFYLTQKLMH